MEEILKLYNHITEGVNNTEDLILRMNDTVAVYLLLVKKAFEVEQDNSKRSLLCDSIKTMQNNMVSETMKIVTSNEMKIIEDDK